MYVLVTINVDHHRVPIGEIYLHTRSASKIQQYNYLIILGVSRTLREPPPSSSEVEASLDLTASKKQCRVVGLESVLIRRQVASFSQNLRYNRFRWRLSRLMTELLAVWYQANMHRVLLFRSRSFGGRHKLARGSQ
jgi:hypothetical protein